MNRRKVLLFIVLTLPATVITAHTWLWIIGLAEGWPESRVFAALVFVMINYSIGGMVSGFIR